MTVSPEEADIFEQELANAPGARKLTKTDAALTRADRRAGKCAWCGTWTLTTHCNHCRETGYPRT